MYIYIYIYIYRLLEIQKTINGCNKEEKDALEQEVMWGIKCVLECLNFLHTNGLVHGYLGLIHIYTYIYAYVYIYIYVCMYIYKYIYIHRHSLKAYQNV
jgi:hypothetical protein